MPDIFTLIFSIPVLILVARIFEAALETLRTIYISKGHANLSACVGIVKTGIWLISTGLVITNLTDTGTFLPILRVMASERSLACRSRT